MNENEQNALLSSKDICYTTQTLNESIVDFDLTKERNEMEFLLFIACGSIQDKWNNFWKKHSKHSPDSFSLFMFRLFRWIRYKILGMCVDALCWFSFETGNLKTRFRQSNAWISCGWFFSFICAMCNTKSMWLRV